MTSASLPISTPARYLQPNDRVIVNGQRGTFIGRWPDNTLGKVRLDGGPVQSFMLSDIKSVALACIEAVRDAFELEAAE